MFNHRLDYFSQAGNSELYKVFHESIWPGNLYRPVVFLSFILTNKIAGKEPFIYHLTNVLLHTGVVVGVFFLVKELFDKKTSFLTSILFAIHPVHVEVVANISYRPELFTAFFGIWGSFFALKGLSLIHI